MRNGDGGQTPSLDMAQPIDVTLSLGGWNTVLTLIAKAPWDVADPLMQTIRRQIAGAISLPPDVQREPDGARP